MQSRGLGQRPHATEPRDSELRVFGDGLPESLDQRGDLRRADDQPLLRVSCGLHLSQPAATVVALEREIIRDCDATSHQPQPVLLPHDVHV